MILQKKEELANRQLRLTITVERDAWEKALNDAYQEVKALYPVEGYAVGKAPREALEKAYSHDLFYQEAVNETFPRALVEAFGQEEILVAGAPELRIVDIGPEGFTFAALAELYPEVKLGKYKGLAAPMPQAELSNDDVDKAESEWLQAHLVEEERDRAAMGDEVTLDFDGSVDGVPFDGGKAENYPLLLGSGMFIDGFEEQVAGIRPEEEREIHVTFPQQYTPELAGKAAVFRVKAHRIVRRSMPELNDEFARAQGFSDAAALRQAIMSAALQRKEAQARDAYADALVQQVIAGMEVDIPERMVQCQLDGLLQDMEQQLQSQGATMDAYLEMAGITREDLRRQAESSARASVEFELAMTEIARQEGITITEEELEEYMNQQEEDEENGSNSADAAQNADSEGGGLDLSMLLRVQELMGAVQSQDEDAKLLLALRPHVQERKQKKIDQAVKLLKLYAVFSAVRENGLLQDLL